MTEAKAAGNQTKTPEATTTAQAPVATGTPAPAITESDIKAIEFQAFDNGRADGVTSERARIGAILTAWQAASGQALGMAAVAIEQGLSAEAATAMIGAHAAALAAAPRPGTAPDAAAYRASWLAEGTQQVGPADSATGEEPAPDDSSDPEAAAKHAWERDAALRAEFGNDFGRYKAFRLATAAGRVKILREARASALDARPAA
jgi:hypothetical protein